MITLKNVSLSFDTPAEKVIALNNVTFEAAAGDIVTVMGASGSGKTTLINVIAGLLAADTGDIFVANHNLAPMSESQKAELRLSDIGVIFQDHNLIPELTAAENIMLPMQAKGIKLDAARAAAEKLLAQVGLKGMADRYPKELSGGQRQRVGIARSLSGGKKVLLADEPTGSLDAKNSESVFQLLQEIAAGGVCVIIATHDKDAMRFATRNVYMRDGVLTEN